MPLLAVAALALLGASGCALTPKGLRSEEARLAAARSEWKDGAGRGELPQPSDGDDWRGFLRRALVANGDVRSAWFEWKASVVEVTGASEWPNTNLAFGYSYTFSNESVKSFDRSTFTLGADTMQNLSFPGKAMVAGRAALEKARASGERFRAAKFDVQRRTMDAWLDLALAAENERLARQRVSLAGVAGDAATAALLGGGSQGALLGARIDTAKADDEVAAAAAEVSSAKAALAAVAAIDAPVSISTPTRLPSARALPADPAVLERAVADSPATRELRHDKAGREAAVDLAELQWIPDINPQATFMGSADQLIGIAAMLPTRIASIRSGVQAAKAMRAAASARLRQSTRDQAGEVRATLIAAAGAMRARRLLEERVLPDARSMVSTAESAWSAGSMELADVVEARLAVLEVRGGIAEAAVDREKQLAALEEMLGADLEALAARSHEELAHLTETPR